MKTINLRKKWLLVFVLAILSWANVGCDLDEAVQLFVDVSISNNNLPSLAVGVINNNGIQATAVGGINETLITPSSVVDLTDSYMIGSCSKSFTATVIGILVDKGELSLDQTIWEIFPQYADLENDFPVEDGEAKKTNREALGEITIRNLLTHTAGLKRDPDRDPNDPDVGTEAELMNLWHQEPPAAPSALRYFGLAHLLKMAPNSEPGYNYNGNECIPGSIPGDEESESYCYSNVGYMIAGAVAESVAGISYEELVQNEIFTRLNMTTAGFGWPVDYNDPAQVANPDEPWGHNKVSTLNFALVAPGENVFVNPIWAPAGGIKCSIGDFLTYANWHLQGHLGNFQDINVQEIEEPAEMFQTLHTPYIVAPDKEFGVGEYAMGWLKVNHADVGDIWAHSGNVAGFNSLMVFSPSSNSAIVLTTNTNSSGQALIETALNIYNFSSL